MREREERRNNKPVTLVEKELRDLTPDERQASLEARVAALEAEITELKQLLKPPAQ